MAAIPLCLLSVSSATHDETTLYDIAYFQLRNRLQGISGVVAPAVYGGKLRRILAYVDRERLEAKSLSPRDVVSALQSNSVFIPVGSARLGRTEYQLDTNALPPSPDSTRGPEHPATTHTEQRRARIRGADLGEWPIDGVPSLASIAPHEQSSGPMDRFAARGFERAGDLRDSAQTEHGQVAIAVHGLGLDDCSTASRAPGLAMCRRRPPWSAVGPEWVTWTPARSGWRPSGTRTPQMLTR